MLAPKLHFVGINGKVFVVAVKDGNVILASNATKRLDVWNYPCCPLALELAIDKIV
jgi:hypothetical protein